VAPPRPGGGDARPRARRGRLEVVAPLERGGARDGLVDVVLVEAALVVAGDLGEDADVSVGQGDGSSFGGMMGSAAAIASGRP
jgi:hypothetical protein